MSGFIWRRYHLKGWKWCDDFDKSDWTSEQVGQCLACLPFIKETWDRASEWFQAHESQYWTRTGANAYQADAVLAVAIEKLIEHGRPDAAINCLYWMCHSKQPIDSNQCVRALLAALSYSEPSYAMDGYHIVELNKFFQAECHWHMRDGYRAGHTRLLPIAILERYEKWKDIVEISGPEGLKLIKGMNDEPRGAIERLSFLMLESPISCYLQN